MKDMADPKVGWIPSKEDVIPEDEEEMVGDDSVDEDEWIDVVGKNGSEAVEAARLVNFGALWAVIHFILE